MRSFGRGMPTSAQHVDRRSARASSLLTSWWSRIASMIWWPIVWTGLSDDIGS